MQQALLRSRHALRANFLQHGHGASSCAWLRRLPHHTRRNLSDVVTRAVEPGHESLEVPSPVPATGRASKPLNTVPLICPGCGAPTQNLDPNAAGFFGLRNVRERDERRKQEDAVFAAAMNRGDLPGIVTTSSELPTTTEPSTPVCDRCHNLTHQSRGKSVVHPTTESIRAMIEDSPYRRNHIYHVLDAADFPMSLIPNLTSALLLPKLRTQNRRSKSKQYIRDRIAEISFIITRSDLLGPKKEQVDKIMAYVQQVLRDALGRSGRNVRLGNIRLVSAKRGWWTKNVKEEIYARGGAGWLVGKVNVGKSALVEAVFPKGRMDDLARERLRVAAEAEARPGKDRSVPNDELWSKPEIEATAEESLPRKRFTGHDIGLNFDEQIITHMQVTEESSAQATSDTIAHEQSQDDAELEPDDEPYLFDETDSSLLPPPPVETPYPTMPTVSALPGTTASPIRLPFGKGRGELIDLPGVERSQLDLYVLDEHKKNLVMKHRIVPEQQTVKPGQSLLLGGLIRITPKTEGLIFLMYGFLPAALEPHVTSNEKALAIQTGKFAETGETYTGGVTSNATEDAKTTIKSAGTFKLRHDVTRIRAGPVTGKAAGKMKPENLPYVVYGLDILIEGVGWVEIVAQMRRRAVYSAIDPFGEEDKIYPEIEVFSPLGRFIGSRQPLNAWMIGGPKKVPVHARRSRPRQSMSYKRRVAGGGRTVEAIS